MKVSVGSVVAEALRRSLIYKGDQAGAQLVRKFSIFEVSVLISFCAKLLLFEGMANSVHQALNSHQNVTCVI